ncbi:MAG: segregation/condensation protein A [Alphaproteobacteria bacterium]|nr:segregation/condensation protein A [Alphaproteobacteria bacterium]
MAETTATVIEGPWEAPPVPVADQQLVVDLDGYEGPLDMLLALARAQKVDLTKISILQLAEQYLTFIQEARALRLELAADYLVMAAWLAYLKSRLLLPTPDDDDAEPTGEAMAEALQFQLRRLAAMREAVARLLARSRLGRDIFARGAPETVRVVHKSAWSATIYDLLKAYADYHRRTRVETLSIAPSSLHSMEEALERLRMMLGRMPEWSALSSFLPLDLQDGLGRRSALAATLLASLEMARQGTIELRQGSPFGPIFLRRKPGV